MVVSSLSYNQHHYHVPHFFSLPAPAGHKQESSQPALLPGRRSCLSPPCLTTLYGPTDWKTLQLRIWKEEMFPVFSMTWTSWCSDSRQENSLASQPGHWVQTNSWPIAKRERISMRPDLPLEENSLWKTRDILLYKILTVPSPFLGDNFFFFTTNLDNYYFDVIQTMANIEKKVFYYILTNFNGRANLPPPPSVLCNSGSPGQLELKKKYLTLANKAQHLCRSLVKDNNDSNIIY